MTDNDGDVTLSREPFGEGIRDNEDHDDHELDYENDLVGIDGDEDDDGGTPTRDDAPEASPADIERIEKRRVHLESSLQEHVRDAVRDSLFSDPHIIETAHACGIPEDRVFTQGKRNRLVFYLKASFSADWKWIYRPLQTRYDIPGETYRIEYNYQHIHTLGDKGNIVTQQKSLAMKERIKAMVMRGMSTSAIVNQLTIDYARFTRLMEGGDNQQLSGDDITYDDVYNLLYALTAKQMRKDDDPLISARLWMEDLENQIYFTYYDRGHGLYHGFSSPWQLNELRKWGDVFCFDGTHHACG